MAIGSILELMHLPPCEKEIGSCRRRRKRRLQVHGYARRVMPRSFLDTAERAFAVREIARILPKTGAIQCLPVPLEAVLDGGEILSVQGSFAL
jgi:hypothetical protein